MDLVVKITPEDGTEKLMRKDKIAGMWMNVEELTLDHVPDVYFLRSTQDPEKILTAEQRSQYVIGYAALREKIDLKPTKDDQLRSKLLDDFIKKKESGKLHGESIGSFDSKPEDGGESYYTIVDWPDQSPP